MLITLLFSIYSEHGEGVWNIFHGERIFSFPLHEDENVKGEACKIFLDRASLSAPSPRRGNQPEHSTAWQRTCFGSRGSSVQIRLLRPVFIKGFQSLTGNPCFLSCGIFAAQAFFPAGAFCECKYLPAIPLDSGCEVAREMRITRTIKENVPEHFFCFGTFFELGFWGRGLRVRTDTKTRPFFSPQ